MLIYNHNKQLIGIDEETLHHLGYATFAGFLEVHKDVADLFVKKPGYVHNFKNFPWIDFVIHSDSDDAKAILKSERKHFSCQIVITKIFLTDAPDQEGYLVHLKHTKSMSGGVEETFAPEPEPQPEPQQPKPSRIPMPETEELTFSGMENAEPTVLEEPDTLDIPDITMPEMTDEEIADMAGLGKAEELPDIPDDPQALLDSTPKPKPMLGDYINQEEADFLANLKVDKHYIYDPHIAADELGLPVDLIEEFIGDFINQANEFREPMFDAALKEDFDEIKVLSHKLKGVAANLRIEDAFEVLTIINNSNDQTEVEANLKQLYRIVAKMRGEDVPEFEIVPSEGAEDQVQLDTLDQEDIYDIGMLLDDGGSANEPSFAPEPTPEPEPQISLEDDDAPLPMLEDIEISLEAEPAPEPEPEAMAAAPVETTPQEEPELDLSALDIDLDGDDEPEPEPVPAAPSGSVMTLQYDMKGAADELGISEDFLKDLLEEFVQEAVSHKDSLYRSIEAEEMGAVQEFASEFVGFTENLRTMQITESLQILERQHSAVGAKQAADTFYQLIDQL